MIEYKVIDTRAVGVPVWGKNPYTLALARGLNKMAEEEGWELVGLLGTLMFFTRPRRAKTWVEEQEDA